MSQWSIFRTVPIGKTYGQAFPIFIRNMDYHLADLQVFADGLIDCWELVDIGRLPQKLASGWIALQPPDGSRIGIYNLGSGQIANAEWLYSPADIVRRVEQAIHLLKPSLVKGRDATELNEIRKGVRHTIANDIPYYINADGSEIPGKKLPVFVVEKDVYRMTNWFVFADRQSQIGPTGDLIPIEQSIEWLQDGRLITTIPDGARVYIEGLGHCNLEQGWWNIDSKERIREALDELAVLKANPVLWGCVSHNWNYTIKRQTMRIASSYGRPMRLYRNIDVCSVAIWIQKTGPFGISCMAIKGRHTVSQNNKCPVGKCK